MALFLQTNSTQCILLLWKNMKAYIRGEMMSFETYKKIHGGKIKPTGSETNRIKSRLFNI